MAINRFAILTDGFPEPGEIGGTDWGTKTGRALLLTDGYFNDDIISPMGAEMLMPLYALWKRFWSKVEVFRLESG